MGTKAECRAGIVTRLNTISGLRAYPRWPNAANPPCAIVRSTGAVPHTTFAQNGMMRFVITVAVSMADPDRAQTALDLYTDLSGTSSIIAALEGDETLGGKAQYLDIGNWSADGALEVGESKCLAAELPVGVHTTWTWT